MRSFRVALCQCQSDIGTPAFDPREKNFDRLQAWAKRAQQEDAELAIFGELYLTGYGSGTSMHHYALAPCQDDPWVSQLTEVARSSGLWLIVGTASAGPTVPGDIYNSAFLISPEGLTGVYSKTHVATFVVDEKTLADEGCFYSAGSDINVHDTPFAKLGIQVCYDVHFPEISRVLALKGAEVIINISAAVSGFERFWEVLLPVRAEENQIWYVMSSVVGQQGDASFFGGSRVMTPNGQEHVRGPDNHEELVIADLDSQSLTAARRSSHRLSARRPELYLIITDPIPRP